MLTLRELIIEYILFAWTDSELAERFLITDSELTLLSDQDLLEIYDTTLLSPINQPEN